MSYEPTNWKTGDVVTSAKLNKLENGVANSAGFLKVTSSYDDQTQVYTMDKTWQEIHDALANGEYVILVDLDQEMHFVIQNRIIYTEHIQRPGVGVGYAVVMRVTNMDSGTDENKVFTCDTVNDYPQYHFSDDVG